MTLCILLPEFLLILFNFKCFPNFYVTSLDMCNLKIYQLISKYLIIFMYFSVHKLTQIYLFPILGDRGGFAGRIWWKVVSKKKHSNICSYGNTQSLWLWPYLGKESISM
jgi:hypothetical protein